MTAVRKSYASCEIIIPPAGHSAEELLDERASGMQEALDAAGVGLWLWLPQESILIVSSALRRLLGISRQSTMDLREIVIRADRERLERDFQQLSEPEPVALQRQTYQLFSAEPARTCLSISSMTPHEEELRQGIFGTLQVFASEISPEADIEHASGSPMFRTAFHASSDAMSIIDIGTGRVLEINGAFTAILGHTQQDLHWQRIRDAGLTEDTRIFQMLSDALARGESARNIETVVRRRNGENRTITYSTDPMSIFGEPAVLVTIRDIHDITVAQQKIHRQAYHDPLTDLPNRAMLLDRMHQQVSLHKRHEMSGAVLFIDLDKFKDINDTLGHSAGDMLLKIIAARLESAVRQEDTVARLGGDEFIVMLTGIKSPCESALEQIKAIAANLLNIISEPMMLGEHMVHVTPSIGVATFPEHGVNPQDLIKFADIALYRSKDAGRNTVSFFSQDMLEVLNHQVKLEREVRAAVDRNELCAHYQPQVDTQGNIIGAEALVRWSKPDGETVAANEFIPALESTGLINRISWNVLHEACSATAQLLNDKMINDTFTISVNLCPLQFEHANFTEMVRDALSRSGLPGRMLNLEITESMTIASPENAIEKMNSLKGLGVTFSIDDFGTGYSSLAYVQRLPVSALKIDREFVKEAATILSDSRIIAAIVSLGASLGLNVIAEGVETEAQREMLISHGCRQFQGYLYSPAIPLTALIEKLQERQPS